jgi:hypothetical protein
MMKTDKTQTSQSGIKEGELKKRTEELFGKELARDVLERIKWSFPVAAYNKITGEAYVTTSSGVFPFLKVCSPRALFDIGGIAATGNDGKRVFRLSEFACFATWQGEQITTFDYPINVVATPLSSEPCFVTLMHVLLPDSKDVEITVFAWDGDGKPAAGVAFDWRCRVPYSDVIL